MPTLHHPKVCRVCHFGGRDNSDGWASHRDLRAWDPGCHCIPSECDYCHGVGDGWVSRTVSFDPYFGCLGPWDLCDLKTRSRTKKRTCWDNFGGGLKVIRPSGAVLRVGEAWPPAALLQRQIIKNYQLPSMKLNHNTINLESNCLTARVHFQYPKGIYLNPNRFKLKENFPRPKKWKRLMLYFLNVRKVNSLRIKLMLAQSPLSLYPHSFCFGLFGQQKTGWNAWN